MFQAAKQSLFHRNLERTASVGTAVSAEAATSLALDVGANQLKGVAHAVNVAALVVVARVHAGTDQAVTNVVASRKRCLDVGAVVRVHIDRVVERSSSRAMLDSVVTRS